MGQRPSLWDSTFFLISNQKSEYICRQWFLVSRRSGFTQRNLSSSSMYRPQVLLSDDQVRALEENAHTVLTQAGQGGANNALSENRDVLRDTSQHARGNAPRESQGEDRIDAESYNNENSDQRGDAHRAGEGGNGEESNGGQIAPNAPHQDQGRAQGGGQSGKNDTDPRSDIFPFIRPSCPSECGKFTGQLTAQLVRAGKLQQSEHEWKLAGSGAQVKMSACMGGVIFQSLNPVSSDTEKGNIGCVNGGSCCAHAEGKILPGVFQCGQCCKTTAILHEKRGCAGGLVCLWCSMRSMIATYYKDDQEETALIQCLQCRKIDPTKNRERFIDANPIASLLLFVGLAEESVLTDTSLRDLSWSVKPIMQAMFRKSAFHTIWANFLLLRAEGLIQNVEYIVASDPTELMGREDQQNKVMQDQTRNALAHLARVVLGEGPNHLNTILSMTEEDLKSTFFPGGLDPSMCRKKAASQLAYWCRLCGIQTKIAFSIPSGTTETGVFYPQPASTNGIFRYDSARKEWVRIWVRDGIQHRDQRAPQKLFQDYMLLLGSSLDTPYKEVSFVIPSLLEEMKKQAEVLLKKRMRSERQLTEEECSQCEETLRVLMAKYLVTDDTTVGSVLQALTNQRGLLSGVGNEGGPASKRRRRQQNAEPRADV